MGNICVSKKETPRGDMAEFDIALIDPTKNIGFTGVETTLIDYTISRAEIFQDSEDVAYLDLENDLSLFEGDAEEEYQYEIYRYMRSAM